MKRFEKENGEHYLHVNEMMKNMWRNDDGEVFNEDEMHRY